LDIHHKDYNKLNNAKENLVCLCSKCHNNIHIQAQVRYVPEPKIIEPEEEPDTYFNRWVKRRRERLAAEATNDSRTGD